VTPYYDPMLAKVIVHAASRPEAIARLDTALRDFHVTGVATNIAYLLAILREPAFRAGDTQIRFLEDHLSGWRPPSEIPDEVLLALAAEQLGATAARERPGAAQSQRQAPRASAWTATDGWRNM
jgi:3-methylcrotonyl-CoA carboxylase alpha subunit